MPTVLFPPVSLAPLPLSLVGSSSSTHISMWEWPKALTGVIFSSDVHFLGDLNHSLGFKFLLFAEDWQI